MYSVSSNSWNMIKSEAIRGRYTCSRVVTDRQTERAAENRKVRDLDLVRHFIEHDVLKMHEASSGGRVSSTHRE